MTIRVKLFAILRDKAGVAETPIELRAGATVADAIESVAARHRDLRPYLGRAAAAVNLSRTANETVLQDNDELALLPPVSGG